MSSSIIVEHLTKKYTISHQGREPYLSIRDSAIRAVKNFGANFIPSQKKHKATNTTREDFFALNDVSFEVQQGDRVGIIGRNGAGKSTLLKLLSRITVPSAGRITLDGRVASLLEVGTGFHPELTGRENIFMNGGILGMTRAEIRSKFDEIVSFAEVEQFLDTPVKRYSSGMYVRLAFAVAAHLEPEILLVDEVLAVGDAEFQKKCLGKMEDVALNQGRTVLFVSHNMGAIHRLCTRCVLLNKGQVLEYGQTANVIEKYISQGMIERPEYIQGHISDKPINLRKACLLSDNDELLNTFQYDQKIKIKIDYEVNKPISGIQVQFGIFTAENAHVFVSCDSDLDPSLTGNRRAGQYSTTVELPPKWLNAGRYTVVVAIAQASGLTFDRVELSSFTILDIGTPQVGRGGILQPSLTWTTTQST